MTGCSFLQKAKENVIAEVSTYEIAVASREGGFVYRENGKFYYKNGDVTIEIQPEDVAKYTLNTIR
jgi:hypothetical protein